MTMSAMRRASYTGARGSLIERLSSLSGAITVLDVGCSSGATGRLLKQRRPDITVIGIEVNPDLAKVAEGSLERVLEADAIAGIEQLIAEGSNLSAVIFGDVLEHLVDPWRCVDLAQQLMPNGGLMVASIPNVAHYDTFIHLLRGTWPMRDRGIHDDSHLRFFARKDLHDLFDRGRASIIDVQPLYRIVERPHRANRAARYLGWIWPTIFTFQFMVTVNVDRVRGCY